jgi:beta-glucosidase
LYLDAISLAIYEDGVVVKGYYVWSLMGNYGVCLVFVLFPLFSAPLTQRLLEWSAGYGPRFGIVHVDFKTLERTVKSSAYYLRDTLMSRRKASS